jgi:hypothetical protein
MRIATIMTAGFLALAVPATGVSAATVTLTNVTGGNYQTIYDGFLAGTDRIVEDFAGAATPGGNGVAVNPAAQARTAGNSIDTAVGTFAGLGGMGGGTSVTGNRQQIQIRSGNNAGRFNVLETGGNFLDSNDTNGFSWTIENSFGGLFRGVSAFITDPNDAGRRLTATLLNDGVEVFRQTLGTALGTGTVWHLTADFTGVSWTTAVFSFDMRGNNDGLGISNATLHVAPIPLPAAGLLLLAGLGALAGAGAAKRRRAAA